MKISQYSGIIRLAVNELFSAKVSLITRIAILIMRMGLLGVIYKFAYESNDISEINGITYVQVAWAVALIQLVYNITKNVFESLKDEIVSGQIETKLNKPYSILNFYFFEALGHAIIRLPIYTVVTFVAMSVFFGYPEFTVLQLVSMVLLVSAGFVLLTVIYQLIALIAFWIENPDPVFWIINKLAWIVNGTFVPLSILPIAFKQFADVFPLSAPFYIGRVFEINEPIILVKFLLVQVVWIVVFVLLNRTVYRTGIRKISINGG